MRWESEFWNWRKNWNGELVYIHVHSFLSFHDALSSNIFSVITFYVSNISIRFLHVLISG